MTLAHLQVTSSIVQGLALESLVCKEAANKCQTGVGGLCKDQHHVSQIIQARLLQNWHSQHVSGPLFCKEATGQYLVDCAKAQDVEDGEGTNSS